MKEEWRPVVGYDNRYVGRYEVSNLGNVRSLRYRGHDCIKQLPQHGQTLDDRYKTVTLFSPDWKRHAISVHQLVAKAFIPNPNEYREVNHIDGDPSNNRVDNLEWCSRSQNITHAYRVLGSNMGNKKKVICVETGRVFTSGVVASKWLGLKMNSVNAAICRGGTAGGYHWAHLQRPLDEIDLN